MGATNTCCHPTTHTSTDTLTVQYENQRYMEKFANGFINAVDTQSVKTPLQCDPNPPHKELPIFFDLVTRFNNSKYTAGILVYVYAKHYENIMKYMVYI